MLGLVITLYLCIGAVLVSGLFAIPAEYRELRRDPSGALATAFVFSWFWPYEFTRFRLGWLRKVRKWS